MDRSERKKYKKEEYKLNEPLLPPRSRRESDARRVPDEIQQSGSLLQIASSENLDHRTVSFNLLDDDFKLLICLFLDVKSMLTLFLTNRSHYELYRENRVSPAFRARLSPQWRQSRQRHHCQLFQNTISLRLPDSECDSRDRPIKMLFKIGLLCGAGFLGLSYYIMPKESLSEIILFLCAFIAIGLTLTASVGIDTCHALQDWRVKAKVREINRFVTRMDTLFPLMYEQKPSRETKENPLGSMHP